MALQYRGSESEIKASAGLYCSGNSGRNCSMPLSKSFSSGGFWLTLAFLVSWQHNSNLYFCLPLQLWFDFSLQLHLNFPLFIRTAVIGLRSTLIQYDLILNHFLYKDPISNEVTFTGTCWWLSTKEVTGNAGDTGLIPGLGRSLGEGNLTHSSTLACRIP